MPEFQNSKRMSSGGIEYFDDNANIFIEDEEEEDLPIKQVTQDFGYDLMLNFD